MDDGRVPKDLLYRELSEEFRSRGRPRLRFKDTCKRDLKSVAIDIQSWESLTDFRDFWKVQNKLRKTALIAGGGKETPGKSSPTDQAAACAAKTATPASPYTAT